MTALATLVLAGRGELDVDAPVKKYRPQFAAAGKEDVKVKHLLDKPAARAPRPRCRGIDHRAIDVIRAVYESLHAGERRGLRR